MSDKSGAKCQVLVHFNTTVVRLDADGYNVMQLFEQDFNTTVVRLDVETKL